MLCNLSVNHSSAVVTAYENDSEDESDTVDNNKFVDDGYGEEDITATNNTTEQIELSDAAIIPIQSSCSEQSADQT
jgi:hypothetical protein